MASTIILSDNGVSSGSAGIKTTGGNDGTLLLQTTTSGGTATTAVTINNVQNFGFGSTLIDGFYGSSAVTTRGVYAYTSSSTNCDTAPKGLVIRNDDTTTGNLSQLVFGSLNTGNTPVAAASIWSINDARSSGFSTGSLAFGTVGGSGVISERMRLDASGRLGVGGTAPISRIQTFNGSDIRLSNTDPGGSTAKWGEVIFSLAGSPWDGSGASIASYATYANQGDLRFYYSAGGARTEAARIDLSGNLLVGTTSVPSGGQKMNIAGGITPATDNAYIFGNSGLRWQALYAANGTIQTSDERAKTDIVDSPLGLAFINSLRPVAYKFKVGKNEVLEDGSVVPVAGVRQHFGLLAQDVKQSIGNVDFGGWILTDPENQESDQGLRYDEFISPLIKAIQEQSQIIQTLTQRVEALEGAKA